MIYAVLDHESLLDRKVPEQIFIMANSFLVAVAIGLTLFKATYWTLIEQLVASQEA